jgi:lipoyl(octanoyl) transferase
MINEIKEKIKWKVSNNLVNYEDATIFMENEVENIIQNKSHGTIWLCQHPSVFTAGISAKEKDLMNKKQIPVVHTNRGGQYTYHGPGVQIIYVMLNLKQFFDPNSPDIAKFVNFLEKWIINTLSNFKIEGHIRKDRVGIWVENKDKKGHEDKIAAIGIKVKKWVCYHGIALNLNPDLSFFKDIIPCGISEEKFQVTSLAALNKEFNIKDLHEMIKKGFLEQIKEL